MLARQCLASASRISTKVPIPPRVSTGPAAQLALRRFGNPSPISLYSHCGHRRRYATGATGDAGDKRGYRISYLFGGLASLGLLVTIYGLLEYYTSLRTWPEPIRTPLKAALRARDRGDFDRSEGYFRKAIEAAEAMPSSSLNPDPLLKLSGLYISLSHMFETTHQPIKAYTALRDALPPFGVSPLAKNPQERLSGGWNGGLELTREEHERVIGIHQKLGQMAHAMGDMRVPPPYPLISISKGEGETEAAGLNATSWDGAAEEYLSSALTAMLRLGLAPTLSGDGTSAKGVVAGRDVDLGTASGDGTEIDSGRVDKRGLGMTMEALSEVYARRGQYDVAGQLLIQAVSTLLPPQTTGTPPARDRCQAAMLMNTISSHALQPRTAQAIKSAKSWSMRSLQLSEQALNEGGGVGGRPGDVAMAICARARAVGLHNLGMLAELEGDLPAALGHFTSAQIAAKESGFVEGRREATEAIRRVQSLGGTIVAPSTR